MAFRGARRMRLYHFDYSTYSRKVRKCLELKGLACELVLVPYLDRRVIADLTNGYVMVPVLEDGGRVITEVRGSPYLPFPPLLTPFADAAAGLPSFADGLFK